jgi:hypothetical protein
MRSISRADFPAPRSGVFVSAVMKATGGKTDGQVVPALLRGRRGN